MGEELEKAGNKSNWRKSKEGRQIIFTSMDVVGLYPNMNIKRCAEECGQEIMESKVEYKNIDFEMAGKFIASNMTQEDIDKEGLSRIIPRRKSKFGVRPGETTQELYSKREKDGEGIEVEKDSKWCKVWGVLTKQDERKMLKKVLEIGITTLMRNHVYQFEGRSRVQRD